MGSQAQINRVSLKSYKYTYSGRYLTSQQRDFYEENGFIVIRNLVDHRVLDLCKEQFLDICNGKVEKGLMTVMKDLSLKDKNVKGEDLIIKIQDLGADDVFFNYIGYAPMVDIVESIIGPNIIAFHSMLVNKPPNATEDSSRHPLHQDLLYFPFRPAESIVASWTAMERIDELNGCLFVVPGSHKGELHRHEYPPNIKNKSYYGVLGFDNEPKVNLIMEKGDTVFFHPLLLHGSGPNLTKGFRKAISCHYADSNCHFIDVRGTFHEQVAREIEKLAVKKGFGSLQFQDIFHFKSQLIRGAAGEFFRLDSLL